MTDIISALPVGGMTQHKRAVPGLPTQMLRLRTGYVSNTAPAPAALAPLEVSSEPGIAPGVLRSLSRRTMENEKRLPLLRSTVVALLLCVCISLLSYSCAVHTCPGDPENGVPPNQFQIFLLGEGAAG